MNTEVKGFIVKLLACGSFHLGGVAEYIHNIRTKMLMGTLLIILFVLISQPSYAANWFVRPDGTTYGYGNGSDWTNALEGFGSINWSSITCGDTIWVAGGTYNEHLYLDKTCTNSTRTYIRRARSDATECTSAAGWSAGMDSTVLQDQYSIRVEAGKTAKYITVSGKTTSSGGDHGWHVDYKGMTSGSGINFVDTSTTEYLVFEYLDLEGPGYVTLTSDCRGMDLTPYPGSGQPRKSSNNTFSHIKIWDWGSAIYNAWSDSNVWEYLEVYDIYCVNTADYHPNGMYIIASDNGTVRYSTWRKGPNGYWVGEGIFFNSSTDGWEVYGNLFVDLDNSTQKALNVKSVVTNLKIFNNTFYNVANTFYKAAEGCGTGSENRNNIFYDSGGNKTCGTASNNLDQSSPDPFVDSAGDDFRIVETVGTGYPRNAGTNLSAYFTLDRDGNEFGADGTWDIGAYEYDSGVTPTTPTSMSGVTVSPRSIQ